MDNLVSVIVPVYNVEMYLEECIKSIINQTYKDIEIILINDGSSDDSYKICEKYAKKDKRIILISGDNNGVSQARNKGIDISKGKFISFVDSDDYIEPNMIESLVKNIEEHECDIAICGYKMIFNDGSSKLSDNEQNIYIQFTSEEVLKIIFKTNQINGFLWNKMFKREVIGNIRLDKNLDICEDLYFVSQLLKQKLSIYYSSNFLYNYRNVNNSATMSIEKIFTKSGELKYDLVYKQIIQEFKENNELVRLIKLRSIKTLMEAYYLTLKKGYKNREVDKRTLSIIKKNKKMYLNSNIKIKFKFIFILIYMIILVRQVLDKNNSI